MRHFVENWNIAKRFNQGKQFSIINNWSKFVNDRRSRSLDILIIAKRFFLFFWEIDYNMLVYQYFMMKILLCLIKICIIQMP